MRKYIIGVDVGGSSIKFGKFDLSGELLEKWQIRTDTSNKGDKILENIATSIKDKVKEEEIKGVGFGVPGPVSNNIVLYCVNLGWSRTNLEKEFRKFLTDNDIIIRVANDANAAAAGEMYKGIAKGYNNVVMFTLGTGVGGGIVIDDKLVEGVNGVAGEWGHIHVDDTHYFKCACGKKGCLETVASATGIVKLAKYNLDKYHMRSPLRRFESFSAKKVIDNAKNGDFISERTIEESMKYLAQAMANLTLIINPEIIVIGGGISHAGQYIIEKIEKYYYDLVEPFIAHTNFALASLGNEAGIYGCCYLIK
ncbi:ROK family glucokinase [Candidatus Izemoplasma sp. B36]|uniref:ROK family glucokinase n=1 Tax=Candidatus Izemoplasma sp. B36 TaxID=3242468 RepID=UPI0035570855